MWNELNTPDAFERDWYGELTNQISHTMVGLILTIVFLCGWREIMQEMPVRSWAFAGIFLGYVVLIEWARQKWLPGDSWFDSLMFGCGCAGALLPFEETAVEGPLTHIEFSHRTLALMVVSWALVLFARVAKRYTDANTRQT